VRVHRNAKTTPKGRALLVARVTAEGWTMRQAAAASGVSGRTGYKWLARYRAAGSAGLEDRPSTPGRRPHRTRARLEQWIVGLRAQRLSGPAIAYRTGLPRATVGNVLRRHGLGRLPPLQPKPPVQRYEWARPGQLVHIDTKALGRIVGVGHRIHGDRTTRQRGVGWEHVHVCIDDASRLAYVETRATNQQHDAIAFLERALAWFAARGVRVERVMSDNGSAYVARAFAAACAQHGLRHLRTRPYTPRTNGKAERFIQTLLREWAYAKPYVSSARRRRALQPWLRYYNHRRPHTALRQRAPITRLQEVAA
jgi:transposase InsO family protein